MTRKELFKSALEETAAIVALEAEGHRFDYTAQMTFPPAPEDVYDEGLNQKEPRLDFEYSADPVGLFTIPLSRAKYPEREQAIERAKELCELRSVKLHRFFKAGSNWVAEVYPTGNPMDKVR